MAVASFLLFLLATAWWLAIQTCSVGLPGSTANLSTFWNTSPGHILLRSVPGNNRLAFGAGFYCSYGYDCDTLVFGVCILSKANYTYDSYDPYYPYDPTQVVWSANRDHLVAGNATLNFTADGDLLMQDINGSLVWSTNTSGQSVAGMKITNTGNLVLFNHNNTFVWQSFDHPTDCLLPSQRLVEGMRLTPNSSATNWTTSNRFYLTVLADGLYAFAGSSPPQLYYDYRIYIGNSTQQVRPYASLINGSLATFVSPLSTEPDGNIILPPALSLQYLRFESDGHLRLYEWKEDQKEWSLREDAFKLHDCDYPYVCGEYGICSSGQCSCPTSDMSRAYFTQLDSQIPDLGCIPVIPISCQSLQQHQLIGIPNVSYFNYIYPNESIQIDEEGCKLACLRNCSCRAALFHYFDGFYSSCSLLTHVLSLEGMGHHPEQSFRSTAFLKVQVAHSLPSSNHRVLLVSMVAGVISLLILIILASLIALRRHHKKDDEDEFVDLPGMPTRFTFEALKVATRDFSDKLGQGGFGSVFKGQLDDERIAVKHLDRAGQGKKEFLAEVQTIGSLHHINLVRLSGFCAEKSHRLLVYEYMPRGSLDNWIYYRDNFVPLDWHTRCKIITDIARGLSYLHEECRQIIAHLDIKPQNILLDDNFNAKVSDFGLSKLIDRDESRVVTRMRGTPGYLAPEWLTSQITEKVDVYSFGVVVMEIISGRKNIDYSQPEKSIQLITLLQEKAKNNLLEDMIDRNSDDMLLHKEEVIQTMKLATWCLQSDTNKRPSMSVVVKVMEGERDVEPNLEYNFFHPSTVISVRVGQPNLSSPPAVSVLSAPR